MNALHFCALLMTALFSLLPSVSFAYDLDPNEIRGKSSKESVTVLQNRYFLKALRPEAGIMVGTLLDEAYLKTTTFGARSGFFLSEWVGIEVGMLRTIVRDSDDRKALNRLRYRPISANNNGDAVPSDGGIETIVTPDPEVNAIHGVTDFNSIVAPFYGKLNFMNKWIVYTDLYGSAGISRIETDQGDKMGVNIGAGERFYIGKNLSLRIDFKDRIFTETRGGVPTRKNSYGMDFGTSYFFN